MSAVNLLPHNLYVVDDDEAVRRSLGLLLLARGYPVQAFASGEAFWLAPMCSARAARFWTCA